MSKQALKYRNGLVALALLVLAVGCGKEVNNKESGATIADVNEISDTADRRSLVGRRVEITSAQVQEVTGNYIFWVGSRNSGVPVAREDKMRGPVTEHVQRGDRVAISGVVRLLETVPQTDLLWDKVNDNERADMLNSRIYIAAESVRVIH
jgi:hypothetical protein